jgi:hypothetical protein
MPNVQAVLILVGRVQASPSDIEMVMFHSLGYGTETIKGSSLSPNGK